MDNADLQLEVQVAQHKVLCKCYTGTGIWGNTNPDAIFDYAMSRSRGYCFTINNPTGWDEADIEGLSTAAEYYVYGRETGEEGTPHLQGYVRFKNAISFMRIKQLLPRAHIEVQKGTCLEAANYCKKDGDYVEWGELKATGLTSKQRWTAILSAAERGDLQYIRDEFPGEYIRYFNSLHRLRIRDSSILDDLQNEWWWGPTGTGKSRLVWERYPDHYAKQLNKWWDGYNDEETVVIEEWAPKNEMTASGLKIWADRYPFSCEVKGGCMRRIRPKRIIVTSNYSLEQCFERMEDLEPMKRRFKQVYFPRTPFMDLGFLEDDN